MMQPGGWGSLLPGQPGVALLRHGWVAKGDWVEPSPSGLPPAVREALQLPDPTADTYFNEYLVEPQAAVASLRIPVDQAKQAAVPALRMPQRKPVRLKLAYFHRYLQPFQLASGKPIELVIQNQRMSALPGWLSLLGGLAGAGIGAALLYTDSQREFRGWLPSLELMLGQVLLMTSSAAVITGITFLGIRATRHHPAER